MVCQHKGKQHLPESPVQVWWIPDTGRGSQATERGAPAQRDLLSPNPGCSHSRKHHQHREQGNEMRLTEPEL